MEAAIVALATSTMLFAFVKGKGTMKSAGIPVNRVAQGRCFVRLTTYTNPLFRQRIIGGLAELITSCSCTTAPGAVIHSMSEASEGIVAMQLAQEAAAEIDIHRLSCESAPLEPLLLFACRSARDV